MFGRNGNGRAMNDDWSMRCNCCNQIDQHSEYSLCRLRIFLLQPGQFDVTKSIPKGEKKMLAFRWSIFIFDFVVAGDRIWWHDWLRRPLGKFVFANEKCPIRGSGKTTKSVPERGGIRRHLNDIISVQTRWAKAKMHISFSRPRTRSATQPMRARERKFNLIFFSLFLSLRSC